MHPIPFHEEDLPQEEAKGVHPARTEILPQHVRALDETPRDGQPLGVLQVEGQAALVPVRQEEEDADAVEEEVGARQCRSQRVPPGGSILTTSAPMSARNWTLDGPSRNWVKERTRTPERTLSAGRSLTRRP